MLHGLWGRIPRELRVAFSFRPRIRPESTTLLSGLFVSPAVRGWNTRRAKRTLRLHYLTISFL